jgi:hypothetical protein
MRTVKKQCAFRPFVSRPASESPHAASGDEPGASPGLNRRRALARLRAVIVLAILLPTAAFALVATYLYHEDFRDARQQLDRGTRVAQ